MSGTKRNKPYWFSSGNTNRFKTNDQPNQETFEDLIASVITLPADNEPNNNPNDHNFATNADIASGTALDKVVSPANLPQFVSVSIAADEDDNTFDGQTIDITKVDADTNRFNQYGFKLTSTFRTWLKSRLDTIPIITTNTSTSPVVYVAYNSAATTSGDGTFLNPYGSLQHCVTVAGSTKAIRVLNSGENEVLTTTITRNTAIVFDEGVKIGSTASMGSLFIIGGVNFKLSGGTFYIGAELLVNNNGGSGLGPVIENCTVYGSNLVMKAGNYITYLKNSNIYYYSGSNFGAYSVASTGLLMLANDYGGTAFSNALNVENCNFQNVQHVVKNTGATYTKNCNFYMYPANTAFTTSSVRGLIAVLTQGSPSTAYNHTIRLCTLDLASTDTQAIHNNTDYLIIRDVNIARNASGGTVEPISGTGTAYVFNSIASIQQTSGVLPTTPFILQPANVSMY